MIPHLAAKLEERRAACQDAEAQSEAVNVWCAVYVAMGDTADAKRYADTIEFLFWILRGLR